MLITFQIAGLRLKNSWFLILLLVVLSSLSFIPNFIAVGFIYRQTYTDSLPGFGYMFYNIEIILFALITLFIFFISYKKQTGITRKRLDPILISFILTLIIGVFFNILLPVVNNDERFSAISPLCVASIIIALAYSIYKWNLLGITVNKTPSYSQISQMRKTKSPDLYRSIRETYFASLHYYPEGITAKNIFFQTGKVNKKGNVYLFNRGIYKFIFSPSISG